MATKTTPRRKRPPRTTNSRKADLATARAILEGVRRLNRGLRLAARRVERETGLSAAQLFVLHHLSEAHATSLNALAKRTFTDRSSVSVLVDRLVSAGLVTRTVAAHDRRQQEMRITPKGIRTLRKAPPAPGDIIIDGIRRLPHAAAVSLGRSLGALNAALGFETTEMLFLSD